ncbi:MAG TPA: hypothetical protein VL523_10435 [Terriglobia bacterium]|nr:hypothetical protein [Terriglobia bacterium]
MTPTRACCLALGLMIALGAAPARAGDRDFQEIVDRFGAVYHQKPMRFMGLISFAARFAHPEGVSGLKLAIFDEIDPSLTPKAAGFDRFMQGVAEDYHPFVRVRSKRDREQTYIYLHEVKNRAEMLLVTVDTSDAVVMKMWLKPEALAKWVDDPVREGRSSAHHGFSGSAD